MYLTLCLCLCLPYLSPTPYNEDSYMMNAEDMDMNVATGEDMNVDTGTDMMETLSRQIWT